MIARIFAGRGWTAIALATVVLAAVLSVMSPVFLTFSNLQSVLIQSSVTGIMAVGMTFIIISGGIDISAGAILFLTAAVFSKLMFDGSSYLVAFLAAMSGALMLGLANGLLVTTLRISPLITTLATYSIYRGTAIHLTGAANIPVGREFGFLGNGKVFDVPVPILILLVVAGIGIFVMTRTRFGIYLRAVGNSERSARETALPVAKVTLAAYAIGGTLAGLGALILLARVGGLQGGLGEGVEFTVIAAVVLGGTRLSGGQGTITGSVFGAVFLVLIDNGLNLMSASPFIYDSVRGAVLIAAVIVDRVSGVRRAKSLLAGRQARLKARSANLSA